MKTLKIFILACFVMPLAKAQNIGDAVRYSLSNPLGTARYSGVSGAFGALGGDLTAVSDNPAGSAIFSDSYASVTLGSFNTKNDAAFGNTIVSTENSDLDLTQAGGIMVINTSNPDVPKFTLGVTYDKTQNFEDYFVTAGTTPNSIDTYFLDYAQGVPLDLLQLQSGESITSLYQFLGENEGYGAQQAFLGFQGFIIDPQNDDFDNTAYISTMSPGNFDQEFQYESYGYNSKAAFNLAAEFGNKLYLGINLNSHFFDFVKNTTLFEENQNSGSQVNYLEFDNTLRSIGAGFSAQLGGIYHISPEWRVGATISTPTWYTIEEETEQALYTEGSNGTRNINPSVINFYQEYDLKTPAKYNGSVAYVFSGKGFLSFDYSYQDFSTIEYGPEEDAFFNAQNELLSNTLKPVNTYKLGGEYLYNKWSFRAGYRYQDSPYENEDILGSLYGYSAGVGYTFGATRLDVALDRSHQDQNKQFYEDSAFANSTQLERVQTSIIATLSFSL